ncbi:MAG TPA: CinA family protein [Quisquiliibacterium sp.]|nr:CinA family protein [Quisquiliibacterium sp.]HQN12672.1 CinA family protein [Quisquiliibacterium sp.]HQP66155.1 CinA family protein [Quisquiliibacterium sp.]
MRFEDLIPLAERVGHALKARGETVAVGESSAAGLVSAALLAVPGASGWYLGGAVVYTRRARRGLVDIPDEAMTGMRSSSEPYAMLLAGQVRARLRASWGLAETGASGPTGNSYGDAAGHSCLAVSGPVTRVITIETGSADRLANMVVFAQRALLLLDEALQQPMTA